MSIRIGEHRDVDLSAVSGGRKIPLSTPGQILRTEFLEPYELSANALARALKVPANRVTAIVNGRRSITADTALRLARYFGTTAEFWLNLQKNYELRCARSDTGKRIEREIEPHAAWAPAAVIDPPRIIATPSTPAAPGAAVPACRSVASTPRADARSSRRPCRGFAPARVP